ncbi:aldo/keto reductase [Petrotoga sp. 9PWA.NaAc.5.4]|uniref:aldo/keto reductase n=1 Tax=Petrotoga sp. 9PWA.NaAc.5.4 TaxID=1434328 RepID=UPI000CB065D2|nr:aldo/keto reductase [Petrotoga sp. 9PWA.NaAc.5.4]PNR96826.1 hypothetical protein X924_02035 [Petrotoga sp. 9PWA.NaAc.5.4]
MEKRMLGKTKEELSIIGLDLKELIKFDDSQAVKNIIEKFILNGVNFFEISPAYKELDEKIVFCINHHRDKLFISGRTKARNRNDAIEDIKLLLNEFNLQYLDLIQLDDVKNGEEIQTIFGPEGALEFLFEAKNQGLIKYVGFSTNKEEIGLKLIDSYDFDVVTFPLDWKKWYLGIGGSLLSKSKEKEIGIIIYQNFIKRLSKVNHEKKISEFVYIPQESYEEVETQLRFSLSKPITSVLCASHISILEWLLKAVDNFTTLTLSEEELLRRNCQRIESAINFGDENL